MTEQGGRKRRKKEGSPEASQKTPASLQGMVQLRAELEEALREKDQFRAMAQRAHADFINYKRRIEEEREEFQRQVTSRLVLKLLDVMDDFERALEHLPPEDDREPWVQGIALIFQKLWSLLESDGVTKIQAQGQPFDPWEHEALLYQESDSHSEGQVVQVLREGYKLHGKVLRPAQVAVARGGGRTFGEEVGSGPEDVSSDSP